MLLRTYLQIREKYVFENLVCLQNDFSTLEFNWDKRLLIIFESDLFEILELRTDYELYALHYVLHYALLYIMAWTQRNLHTAKVSEFLQDNRFKIVLGSFEELFSLPSYVIINCE